MLLRVLTICVLWMIVTLYESCCEYLPYYAFDSIQIESANAQPIAAQDSLMVRISPQNIRYVAQLHSMVTGAYAWECSQGDLGLKYSISDFKIITLQDYDDTHFAGDLLNDIFRIRRYNTTTFAYEEIALLDLEDADQLFLEIIWTKFRPVNNSIQLKVEIIDKRGSTFESSPFTITWI